MKHICLLAAMLSGAALSASAAQADVVFYGGVGGQYALYDEDIDLGGGVQDDFSDSVPGASIFGGVEGTVFQSNVSVGAELSVDYLDSFEDDPFGINTEIDLWAVTLAAKIYVPLDRRGQFRLLGQAGAYRWDAELKAAGSSASDDGVEPLIGAGFDVRVAPGFRVGFDYKYVFLEDTDFHIAGLRGLYYF